MEFEHGGNWADYEEICGEEILDFSANVSPFGLPENVREAASASFKNAYRYPDPECRDLRNAIADKYDLCSEHVVCGNGAADLIYRIAYAVRPRKAIVPAPDFSEYEKALKQVGCEIEYWEWMRGDCTVEKWLYKGRQVLTTECERQVLTTECDKIQNGVVPVNDLNYVPESDSVEGGTADLSDDASKDDRPRLISETDIGVGRIPYLSDDTLTEDLDMIILSNPNNPSGCLYMPTFLRALVAECVQKQILLVVDECFMDFVDSACTYSLLEFVADCRNLIVIRAFTKFYGMAGLRLGWCATSNAELIAEMKKAGPPWSVSIPAQAAGMATLSENSYAHKLRGYVSAERQRLQFNLRRLGLQVIPGAANYILFYSERTDLARLLLERGIAIRDCSNYVGLGPGWYRVAVRLREENQRLLREMAFVLR
ncbi:MAG: pyridoxal phosphate-dependent class II aminotransferase [Lachnospiraceae bacterium]|nr:pyridoxal phosphate-dependent class II aminotransferase [Lachnospiraceae bacterium]